MTLVSFKKFLPIINNSRPPKAGQDVKDFLHISGTPGGWAKHNQNLIYIYKKQIIMLMNSLQIICCEQICRVSVVPSSFVKLVLKTMRHLVDFFLLLGPEWSGNLCSTSTFRSYQT